MIKHAVGLLLLSAALAAACGCNVCRAIVYDPFGPNTLCSARRCGPVCGEPCGPIRGGLGPRAVMAEPGENDGCGECGLPACGRLCRPRGPLAFVFALFTAGSYPGCWGGCGERYWGDWYADPPDCSDPCGYHGNFTGGGCSGCGDGGGPVGMAGQYEGAAMPAPSGGCRTCGQGGQASYNRGGRYPAQSSAGSQQYAATQPYNVHRSATQSYAAGQRSPASYASRGQRPAGQYPSTSSSGGPYAPRLISTTDRVGTPAAPDQGPRLAQPQRADVVQE
jgi:hypothetical protein